MVILDIDDHPALRGALGELCIGGGTVARGYLGRPGQTAETVRAGPVWPAGQPSVSDRRPGAAACGRHGGVPGADRRADQAAGLPIEPGEIEAALRAHAVVRDAVVALRGAGGGGHGWWPMRCCTPGRR